MKQTSVKIVFLLAIILIVSVLFSCSIENYATKKLAANNEILTYLNDNELFASPDSLGLVYIPIKKGNNVIVIFFHNEISTQCIINVMVDFKICNI